MRNRQGWRRLFPDQPISTSFLGCSSDLVIRIGQMDKLIAYPPVSHIHPSVPAQETSSTNKSLILSAALPLLFHCYLIMCLSYGSSLILLVLINYDHHSFSLIGQKLGRQTLCRIHLCASPSTLMPGQGLGLNLVGIQ